MRIEGMIAQGKQLGRTIGIPTANLIPPAGVQVPAFGVYATRVITEGGSYPAVTNVGRRPTVDDGDGITVEPWILDYEGDLYGREITLEFYYFIRPEKKFPDLNALKEEIHRNAEETRKYLQTTFTE